MRSMVTVAPQLSGYGAVLHVYVSVPLIEPLLDGRKYMLPEDVPPPPSRDLRRMRLEKAPRAPSLRVMVRYALKCQSAEDLGKKLRQRYERQERRSGGSTAQTRQAAAEVEVERLLDPVSRPTI
ncbi:hypothetical protein [Bradyrhizobium sp. McL0616]|uniref:hypothetical protein n=1 Tax=Bradyrhizobium sp. McL0616 TaxID=3415674 RepID=UPI003CEA82CD